MEKFNWIKRFYEHRKEGETWISVSDTIPNEFDDYFLIHWNVGIVENFPFDDFPENNDTIEQTNKRIRIAREFGLFLNPNEDELFEQTTIERIAEKFKVDYDYNVLNKIKQTPAIKILEKPSKEDLKSMLHKLSKNESLNFFIEDIFRYPIDDKPKQEMVNVSIDEYFKWQEDFYFDYCTYLFPEDKNWCIMTSEGLPMFLCTKRETTEQIEKDINMEIFKVGYNEKLYQ
ncbi:MAG: hypothetical protein IT265_13475 [Saprospiraceae bacterium]|nr:hypothetical protein [Saprospiraceae bacterium]